MNYYQTYPNPPVQFNTYQPYQPPEMTMNYQQQPIMTMPSQISTYYPPMENGGINYTDSTMNQNYNPINTMTDSSTNSDFNRGMNHLVKSAHKDRGVMVKENGLNTPYHNPTNNIKGDNTERKKQLLNNIQQQMTLSRSSRLQELEKKRLEDEKYMSEMNNYYPFGRYLFVKV
jgi:hypothetical protein